MKRVIYLVIAALVFFGAFSCNDDRTGPLSPNIMWGTGYKFDEETALKKLIVRDVLGYALSTAIDPAVITGIPEGDDTEEVDEEVDEGVSAITINATFYSSDDKVSESYAFADEDGIESLLIDATGGKSEVVTQPTNSSLVTFSPLNITFDFDQFVFINSCGMRASFDGIMKCRVNGKYNRTNENFKGTATCTISSRDNPTDFIYVLEDEGEQRAVTMQINASINGNAFQIESYSFTGTIHVDGRMMTVDNKFNEAAICSVLTD